jgi:hypothetical protein
LVRVTESATYSLWETDLLTGFKEVLALEDVFWGKLTEVLFGSDFAGEKRRREPSPPIHTTCRLTWSRGWSSGWEGGVFLDRVFRFVHAVKQEVYYNYHSEDHHKLLNTTISLHRLLYIINKFFFIGPLG